MTDLINGDDGPRSVLLPINHRRDESEPHYYSSSSVDDLLGEEPIISSASPRSGTIIEAAEFIAALDEETKFSQNQNP